jgi:hypothetical protein
LAVDLASRMSDPREILSTMGELDREKLLARLARKQYGLVSAAQLESLGFCHKYILRRVRIGHWRRIHRGVYSTSSARLGPMQRQAAVLLAAGPLSTLSHQSAAQWLKIATPPTDKIHITVRSTDTTLRIKGVEIHWSPTLPADDVKDRGPLRVTSRGRTMLDLSGVLGAPELRAAFFSCLREDPENRNGILLTLDAEGSGKPGAAALRALLSEELGPRVLPESVLEDYGMELGMATGRTPVQQFRIFNQPGRSCSSPPSTTATSSTCPRSNSRKTAGATAQPLSSGGRSFASAGTKSCTSGRS